MSDSHGFHRHVPEIPDGDFLIHCGDFTMHGDVRELVDFAKWFGELPHPNKIVIPGNHERCIAENPKLTEQFTNSIYLQDSGIEIDGLKFWGNPWTPAFANMRPGLAFYKNDTSKMYSDIPDDLDVLITHGPPHGILDLPNNARGHHVGDKSLFSEIIDKDIKIHSFGHIHESYGVKNGWNKTSKTKFVNCSLIDYNYNLVNKPIVCTLS
jgi:Icc-related predicted phosphoesterase